MAQLPTHVVHNLGRELENVKTKTDLLLTTPPPFVLQQMQKLSPIRYKCIVVPEDGAANTIFFNGHVICKGKKENPRSWAVLERECKHPLIGLTTSEIEKAVGSLTCMSLRFNRPEKVVAA